MKYRKYYLKLKTHLFQIPYTGEIRRIRILLPEGYYYSNKSYPVIYIHDGQNLFYNTESYSGHSWRIIQTIRQMNYLPQMIIVAIDNGGSNRIDEYTPWKINAPSTSDRAQIGGLGDRYGDFIINIIKPFVDSNYRTKKEGKYTGMCGSSLGGNITAYMGIKYQNQIGNLGIFSLANWLTEKDFNNYIKDKQLNPNQKVYIQVGTEEGDYTDQQLSNRNLKQAYIDTSLDYYKQLIKRGISIDNIKIEIISDAKHEEKAWANSLPNCLSFLSRDW